MFPKSLCAGVGCAQEFGSKEFPKIPETLATVT